MTTTLDRNEVQETFGMLTTLSEEQTAIKKQIDSLNEKQNKVLSSRRD